MTPEERQEIRERHVQSILEYGYKCLADGKRWPCDTVRLLADYDHLVEVARNIVGDFDLMDASGWRPEDYESAIETLRALIDPATHNWRDHSSSPHHHAGDDEPIWDLATPEPVEGEPNA